MSVAVRLLVSALLAVAPGIAGAGPATQPARIDTVPVYDSTQIAFDRYTIVQRLGVTGTQAAFRIRGYADLESAERALLTQATELGADGVINLVCFDQTDRIFKPAGYYCYGNAIRLK